MSIIAAELNLYVTCYLFAEASKKKDECTHPGSFGEMCILCGQRLQAESGVTFGYIHKVYVLWDYYLVEEWILVIFAA